MAVPELPVRKGPELFLQVRDTYDQTINTIAIFGILDPGIGNPQAPTVDTTRPCFTTQLELGQLYLRGLQGFMTTVMASSEPPWTSKQQDVEALR